MKVPCRKILLQHAHLVRHLILMEPMYFALATFVPNAPDSLQGALATPTIATQTSTSATNTSAAIGYSKFYPIDATPTHAYTNLLSLEITPSIMFRRQKHQEQIPKQKLLTVGTEQYDMNVDDFWCLQSTDACIRLISQNPNLRSLTESWDDMSSFHRVRFSSLLCRQPNGIVKMHLTKWEAEPEELNLLIENSPKLVCLRFSKLIVRRSRSATHTATARSESSAIPTTVTSTATVTATATATVTTTTTTTVPPSTPLDAPWTPPSSAPVLQLRQIKVLALTHTSFQLSELQIEAPELQFLKVSFSHVNLRAMDTSPSAAPSPSFPSYYFCPTPSTIDDPLTHTRSVPQVIWNTPRLERVLYNRTELQVGLSSILESAHALKMVSIADYEIESRLMAELQSRQCVQLVSIRLACFTGITGKDIRTILRKCPNLVNLYAPEIMMWAGDLVSLPSAARRGSVEMTGVHSHFQGKQEREQEREQQQQQQQQQQLSGEDEEWVCHKLETLSVYVTLDPIAAVDDHSGGMDMPDYHHLHHQHTYQDQPHSCQFLPSWSTETSGSIINDEDVLPRQQQQLIDSVRDVFLDQLVKLTKLKYLDLSGEYVDDMDQLQIGVSLTLKSGVKKLEALKELEYVAITGWSDEMGTQEIEWMKRSWPKLRHVALLRSLSSASKSRIQGMMAQLLPEVVVQEKDRNKHLCSQMYFY
ncbi:hypothetical protein BGZ51_001714 [Haplosporangium sp. Z 767]|nr:hypothetical protein BGZ51_001714 [Haplosporangium sp. Z 767]